jgi:hypothetical protein
LNDFGISAHLKASQGLTIIDEPYEGLIGINAGEILDNS